jgi:geranylgeranyl reductase family protein
MSTRDADNIHDVLIVGAGIAGASAAYFLGRSGLDVVVLERQRLPRYKPCAGALPRSACRLFDFSLEPVVEREITSARFSLRGQRETSIDLPFRPVVMVMRDRLDTFVLQHARARVVEGQKLQSVQEEASQVAVRTESGRQWLGRYLIAADGAASVTARAVGLAQKPRMGAALEAEIPGDGARMERYDGQALFVLGAVKWGYLWVFPKRCHLSVGIGALRRGPERLKSILREELGKLDLTLDGAPLHGHPLPAYGGREQLHTPRTLLVGDAAGLMDPLTGEGMRHAIRSARIAADAILGASLEGYTRRVQREIGSQLALSGVLARLLYSFPDRAFGIAMRNPRLILDFARMLCGELTYRSLLLRAPLHVLGALSHWRRPWGAA